MALAAFCQIQHRAREDAQGKFVIVDSVTEALAETFVEVFAMRASEVYEQIESNGVSTEANGDFFSLLRCVFIFTRDRGATSREGDECR